MNGGLARHGQMLEDTHFAANNLRKHNIRIDACPTDLVIYRMLCFFIKY